MRAGLLGGSGSKLAENLGYDSAASQLKRGLPEVVMQGLMGGAALMQMLPWTQIIRCRTKLPRRQSRLMQAWTCLVASIR